LLLLLTVVGYVRTAVVPPWVFERPAHQQNSEEPDDNDCSRCTVESESEEEINKFHPTIPAGLAWHLETFDAFAFSHAPAEPWTASHALIYVLGDLRL
jgi:hypothetical protein